ncbi:MAG: thiol:disulfide interchange protein DsbA/DsbL [Pseudomonadota bacterium]
MARKAKDKKVIMARNTIFAFVSLLVILILGFGTYVSTGGGQPDGIVADRDYRELPNPRPVRPGEPIRVVEFFSYACIHCKTFDPVLDEWAEEQADDVKVERQPASFSPIYALLAQSFLTLQAADVLEQNHVRMFRAIHDSGRQFLTPQMVADFVDGRGIDGDEFLRQFNSPDVRRAMQRAEREQREFQISSTPSLVVNNKYVVPMTGGQKRALEVTDHLVAIERAARAAE